MAGQGDFDLTRLERMERRLQSLEDAEVTLRGPVRRQLRCDGIRRAYASEVATALKALLEQMTAHGIGGEQIAKIQVTVTGGKVGIAGAEHVRIENFHMDN